MYKKNTKKCTHLSTYEEGEKEKKRRKTQPAPNYFYISFILTFAYVCLCIYFILNFINFIFSNLCNYIKIKKVPKLEMVIKKNKE